MAIHGYDRSIGELSPSQRLKPPGIGGCGRGSGGCKGCAKAQCPVRKLGIGSCCDIPATRDYGVGATVVYRPYRNRSRPRTVGQTVYNWRRGVGQEPDKKKEEKGFFGNMGDAIVKAANSLAGSLPGIIDKSYERRAAAAKAGHWSSLTTLLVTGGLVLGGVVVLGKVLR